MVIELKLCVLIRLNFKIKLDCTQFISISNAHPSSYFRNTLKISTDK